MIRKFIATTNAILWGITAGVMAGVVAVGYTAAVSWIYIFGDDPWPSWSFLFLSSVGIVIGILITVVVARSFSRKMISADAPPCSRSSGHIWRSSAGLAVVFLLWGGFSLFCFRNKTIEEGQIAQEQKQNQYYQQYLKDKTRLTTISFDRNDVQRKLLAVIHFNGRAPDDYSLRWRVFDSLYGTTLINGIADLTFPLPGDVYKVELDVDQISENYKTKVMHGRGGFIVGEGSVQMIVDLVPIFTDEDRRLMPSMNLQNFVREVDRLDKGQDVVHSDLITQIKIAIPGGINVPQ
jgi:ABC-type multidrug transport system fused ATPase/permease subunit